MRYYNCRDITLISVYSLNSHKLPGCFSVYILGTRLPCECNRYTGTASLVPRPSIPPVLCILQVMKNRRRRRPGNEARYSSSNNTFHTTGTISDYTHVVSFPDPPNPSTNGFQYRAQGKRVWWLVMQTDTSWPHSKFSNVCVNSAIFEVLLSSITLCSRSNLTISQYTVLDVSIC